MVMLTLKKICLFVCLSICLPKGDHLYEGGPKDKMASHTMGGLRLEFCYCEPFSSICQVLRRVHLLRTLTVDTYPEKENS